MIHEKVKNDIKDAMRAKDAIKLEVLRGLSALFTNELITKGSSAPFLDDEAVLALIRRSVKQRKDSIEQFTKGGRADLVEKEQAELAILEVFLPKSMSRDEIRTFVESKMGAVIAAGKASAAGAGSTGSTVAAKSGQVVGQVMKELKGKAQGEDVKAVVEELLAA